MSNKSPGGGSGSGGGGSINGRNSKINGGCGPQRCQLILQHCLAIQLTKPGHVPEDFWMYDSGYMIFQNFLAANAQCWWNAPLAAATRALKYAGHVAPGMLLVTAEPCALEVIRGAYARSVLKPPATYVINSVGDIDDCIVAPTVQGQFTPLPEALCDIIMDLTSQGHSATMENIRVKLSTRFPHMQLPTTEIIYDCLAQLMQERKIYQTAKGYFIVTPERRRSRSRPRINHNRSFDEHYDEVEPTESRIMLMTNAEAVHSLYGEISTERDGDLTHQCIQTNLADVICGGNPNDKIIYARSSKRRSASFPTPRSLERRHSLRLFGSSKRLQRCASTRSLSKNYAQTLNTTDSSSSECHSTDSSSPKKASLLSRLFRRSGRSKQRQIETFSAQFPPAEWFNSKAVHLHSVGTQTTDHDVPVAHTLSNSTFYDGSELSQRSLTLPRRHHRRHMSSESTFVISSRDCSPIRRGSPVYCSSSLPRSTHSIPAVSQPPQHNGYHLQSKTQRTIPSKHLLDEQNRIAAAKSIEIYRSPGKRTISTSSNIQQQQQLQLQQQQQQQHHHQQQQQQNYENNNTVRSSNERNHYRNIINTNSGPSSYESGKTSSMLTASGPSSIDSGKVSFSRTSGHSSLDSQTSGGTTIIHNSNNNNNNQNHPHHSHFNQQHQQQQHSPNRLITLNGSPKQSPRHFITKSKLTTDTINRVKSTTINNSTTTQVSTTAQSMIPQTTTTQSPSNSPQHVLGKPPRPLCTTNHNLLPQSNSNSSITLQVTTSNESHIPSTKIFVQNSPVRSVITLENGQLTENSNVVIINNETTTNSKGEIIKRTISKQGSPTKIVTKWDKDQQQQQQHAQHQLQSHSSCYSETEAAYETGDSLSLISETSPDSSIVLTTNDHSPQSLSQTDLIENSKFTKNINNDATMNNSRKLSLQIAHPGNNIVYKNCLKDVNDHSVPSSPIKHNNNFYGLDLSPTTSSALINSTATQASPSTGTTLTGGAATVTATIPTSTIINNTDSSRQYDRIAGSVGNLRYFEKNEKKLNSNCDLKSLQFESPALLAKLNSNPAINTDSLAHILHKNIITVGSEPNLAIKLNECNGIADPKHIDKEPMDRRFSVSTTNTNFKDGGNGSGINTSVSTNNMNRMATQSFSPPQSTQQLQHHQQQQPSVSDNIYNFPSLSDLSFNFTSLAAQKILQGVSISSIDTLVELNMAQEKQQNLVHQSTTVPSIPPPPPAVCTDYGLV